jgi:hypothetical protein
LAADVAMVGSASLRGAIRSRHRWHAAAATPPSGPVHELLQNPDLQPALLRRLRER